MYLQVRINLALVGTFIVTAMPLGYFCERLLDVNARRELSREAHLMMDSAVATRNYTSEEIMPLLNERTNSAFLPQSVPFYAASQNFLKLHEQHPEYSYKEAALNPTNPRDHATDWEADIIEQFRNAPKTNEMIGERDTPMGRSLYLARPIGVSSDCLACHGSPSGAPSALIARYGGNTGFGWSVGEVVGAQVVSVPLNSAEADARSAWRAAMVAIGIGFFFILAVSNVVIYWFVVRPTRRIVRVAEALSRGEPAAEDFPRTGSHEIMALGRAFSRLRISLEKSMKFLQG